MIKIYKKNSWLKILYYKNCKQILQLYLQSKTQMIYKKKFISFVRQKALDLLIKIALKMLIKY